MINQSDQALLEAMALGDEDAFHVLFNRYWKKLFFFGIGKVYFFYIGKFIS